jgi:hypothetical protein
MAEMQVDRLTRAPLAALLLLLSACGGGAPAELPAAPPVAVAAAAAQALADVPAAATVASAPASAPSTAAPAAAPASAAPAATPPPARPPTDPPADTQRAAAAAATAGSTLNACGAIRPFYWEIGDGSASAVSGSETAAGNATAYFAHSTLAIASASKWLYASYVAERLNGVLTDRDLRYLTMRSGHADFQGCTPAQTVDSCLASPSNGGFRPDIDGRFYYDGGHMQAHASLLGLGAMGNRALAAELRAQLGTDVGLSFAQPQPPGGIVMTPAAYAQVLRKMLTGELQIGGLLGTAAVCTNSLSCGIDKAAYTPVPASESWHYSVGHWVEDDPRTGDGAFSSAGAFGFYPWIDADKRYYGVVARVAPAGSGYASAQCGRLLRKAWATGLAQ